jgi:hypothetical protein
MQIGSDQHQIEHKRHPIFIPMLWPTVVEQEVVRFIADATTQNGHLGTTASYCIGGFRKKARRAHKMARLIGQPSI